SLGRLDASSGVIQKGTNVQIGYYDQEQADLNSQKTVLDELWDGYPQINEADIRTVLGNFLFSGEDVLKHVSSLSGGEKARLALAKLKMQNSNLLILDRKSTRLNSSHVSISYAVFCLKKKIITACLAGLVHPSVRST